MYYIGQNAINSTEYARLNYKKDQSGGDLKTMPNIADVQTYCIFYNKDCLRTHKTVIQFVQTFHFLK